MVAGHEKGPIDVYVGGDGRDAAIVEETEFFWDFAPVEAGVIHWVEGEGWREGKESDYYSAC